MREEAAHVTPFGTLLHFKKDIDSRAAARAAGRAAVGPFRDAAARHRAHHAARARRLHHRLAQHARRAALGRPVRLRRICRAPDRVPRGDRPGRARGRGLPALRRGAGGGRGDGAEPEPGAAAQHDPDGRPDRHPRQSDQGQRARQFQVDRLVREEPDRAGAVPLSAARSARSIRASCSLRPS